MRTLLALVFATSTLASACNDPVQARQEDVLGDEDPSVPEGPLHRPGQPCLVCHGEEGSVDPKFSFAGTLYQKAGLLEPLHDATVRFIDGSGQQYSVTSNCAGNFYVGASNFVPKWPVWMKVEYDGLTAEMVSSSTREGSCGACHKDPASPSTVGHVYLVEDSAAFSQGGCQ